MTIYCGIDPGFNGGISIIKKDLHNPIIYKIPVIKETKKVKGKIKTKRSYDLLEMRNIFEQHLDKNSIIFLERVASMPGEGSVSSFNFGKGFGNIEGIIVGLFGHESILVTAQTWKKHFPELITSEMNQIKVEMKELRLISKKIKGKKGKNENKKQVDKLGRQFKSLAKTEARALTSKLYPALSDNFIKKNTDGMAESVLISLYGKDILVGNK